MKTKITLFLLFVFSFLSCATDNSANAMKKQKIKINNVEIKDHPRLLFNKEQEQNIKEALKSNTMLQDLSSLLLSESNRLLNANEIAKIDLSCSREYVYRMITLSLAYRLYGDTKYLNKVNQMLLWVCNYPDWHPAHYLDTAEMTSAVAIAYDWLYQDLPTTTKDVVKKCIYERAISLVLNEYKTGDNESWAKRETNWNVVCNSGMTLGALAVAEYYPIETYNIITNAVKYMPNCLKHFAEDGVCYEGLAYWEYTNEYLCMFLKAMNDNFGTDYGISTIKGVDKTALYYIHTLSPWGRMFGFADSGAINPSNFVAPVMFFFGNFYKLPEVSTWARSLIKRVIDKKERPAWHFFLSIPWFDDTANNSEYKYPLLQTYHGINDIIVFNGERNKDKSIFLIAKGADPDMAHQQLDGGTFIIESDGVRWSEELGPENYSLPGFWDYRPNGLRWKYFMNTNLSHSTINIDGNIQHSCGTAHISKEDINDKQPYAILDMTSLYQDKASNVSRKFQLINDKVIEIEDNIDLINPSSYVCWQMVTKANVTVKGNMAILTKEGKTFYAKILQPQDGVFVVENAKPNDSTIEKSQNGVYILKCIVSSKQPSNKIVIRMSSDEAEL